MGLTISVADAALRAGRSLANTYRNFSRNKNELTSLLHEYESLCGVVRRLSSHDETLSEYSQRALQSLHLYFTDAKHKLIGMNRIVSRGRYSLLVIWKSNHFSEEIARLTATLRDAESKLLQLDSFAHMRSDNAALQSQLEQLKDIVLHFRFKLREEVMLAFRELLSRNNPQTAGDMAGLQVEAVRAAVSTRLDKAEEAQMQNNEHVVDEEKMGREIVQWNATVETFMGQLSSYNCPAELHSEVDQFIGSLRAPWQLNPQEDIQFIFQEDMFGLQSRKEIGAGSTGIVYEGEVRAKYGERAHGRRKAAVKLLHCTLSDGSTKPDFLREVEILSEVQHPCIVEFLGAYYPSNVEQGSTAVIVTELMDGSLESRLACVDSAETAVKILLDVAEGLEHLHNIGIFHMDVKPQNVLLRIDKHDGRVCQAKLADFGMSCKKRFHASQHCEKSMTAVGFTRKYMAPELKQEGAKARSSCDVWSFAVMMYLILRKIYAGDSDSSVTEQDLSNKLNTAFEKGSLPGLANVAHDERLCNLTLACLNPAPELRPSIGDVRLVLFSVHVGISPDVLTCLESKPVQVLYAEGVNLLFGIQSYCENAVLAWEYLSVAAHLGHSRSHSALNLCFSGRRRRFSFTHIFESLRRRAENVDSMLLMGVSYLHGFGTAKDARLAASFFRKAVELGDTCALTALARCDQEGYGVVRSRDEAVKLYEQAVEAGDPVAMLDLGVCYEVGTGVEMDVSKAIELIQRGADAGYGAAKHVLGGRFHNGIGVQRDLIASATLFQQAADSGIRPALSDLGWCYQNGLGVDKNFSKAAALYQIAADAGSPSAKRELGICYENGLGVEQSASKALVLYRQAYILGHSSALLDLGWCFLNGLGTKMNQAKAFMFYQRAANTGDADAWQVLGRCYEEGVGVEPDITKAVGLYRQAVDAGNTAAAISLGRCFENGLGVKKDELKAFDMYRVAAKSGDAAGERELGLCYEYGIGTRKSIAKAIAAYRRAAAAGDEEAICKLATCYRDGLGVDQNVSKAITLFQEAADAGNDFAMLELGWYYHSGVYVERDAQKAFAEYYRSSIVGNVMGLRNVGWCYERGFGVEQNRTKAVECYLQAANAGDAVGMRALGKCYKSGLGVETSAPKAVAAFRNAARLGDAKAHDHLAWCHEVGFGVEKNRAKARDLKKQANEKAERLNSSATEDDLYKARRKSRRSLFFGFGKGRCQRAHSFLYTTT